MNDKKNKNLISKIENNSIAEEVGIEEGDRLLKINNIIISDVIDYLYQISDNYLELEIKKKNGEVWLIEVDKEFDEDLGINFSNPILDQAKSCKNKCVFCFVDQLPSNMRNSLYFKDDDSRLSFLQGNFVTLTNISDIELDRIIEYNISPINVSIHTTNPELREKMLSNKNAGNVLDRLRRLTSNRILINGQIVLCPNINDKEQLDLTIQHLYPLYPNLHSVAIVPVGITKHRENLAHLTPFKEDSALEVINQIEKWQKYLKNKIGSRLIYIADEFYILANKKLPELHTYEDFPQLENGVGLIRKLENEFLIYLDTLSKNSEVEKNVSIITGVSAEMFLKNLTLKLKDKYPKININVYSIKNTFFGEIITVSGLITGKDIINQLKNKELGEKIILPKSMFKSNEDIFLDDITKDDLEASLQIKVDICSINGKSLIDSILK